MLNYFFFGGERLTCLDAAGANDDGLLDISDPIATLQYVFLEDPSSPLLEPRRGQTRRRTDSTAAGEWPPDTPRAISMEPRKGAAEKTRRIAYLLVGAWLAGCASLGPQREAWIEDHPGAAYGFTQGTSGCVWRWLDKQNHLRRSSHWWYVDRSDRGDGHDYDRYRYEVTTDRGERSDVVEVGEFSYSGGEKVLYVDAEFTVRLTKDPEKVVERPPPHGR
jgi:hypothetical protein